MDIATLGFAVDTTGLTQAGTALDQVAAKAQTTAAAATQVGTAATQAGTTAALGLTQVVTAATSVGAAAVAAGAAATIGLAPITPAANEASDAVSNLSNRQMFTLQRSLVELGKMAAGGASPFAMMAMAGEHTALILGEGGGLSGVIESIGAKFSFLASPATAAFAAIGAVVVAGISGLYEYEQQQKAIEIGLNGIGAASGVTAVQVRAIGESVALTGDVSRSVAIGIAADFLKAADNAEQVTVATSDTAKMVANLGVASKDAQKLLEGVFTDPIKGYEDLTKQIGGFNLATDQEIASLQAAGDHSQAVTVALDAVGARLGGMADQTNLAARAWNILVPYFQDASVVMLTSLVPGLSAAQQGLNLLEQYFAPVQTSVDGLTQAQMKAQQQTQTWAESMLPAVSGLTNLRGNAAQAQQSIDALVTRIRASGQETQADAQQLQFWQMALDAATGKINALVNADGSLVTTMQRVTEATQASIAGIQAHGDAAKAAAAGNQAYVNAVLQGLGPEAAQAAALSATDKAFASAAVSAQDYINKTTIGLDLQAVKLQTQIELLGKSATAQQQANAQLQLFDSFVQELAAHSQATFPQMQQAWQLLNTQIISANGSITQTEVDFQNLTQSMGLTQQESLILWNGFHTGISQAETDVSGLTAQLNNATSAARSLGSAASADAALMASLNLGGTGSGGGSYQPGYGANKGYDPFGGYTSSAGDYGGYAEGGSFIIPGPPSSKDNVMVRFAAAKGERVTITAAHEVARQGFAKGGSFITGFTDSEGTLLTEASAHGSGIATGHASTKFHEPKVAKPKAPKKPKALTKHELAVAARNDYGYVGMPGFADGGEFTVGGHGDSMVVEFPAATGERIAITPAHHPQHGFAAGGQFDIAPGGGLSSSGGGPSGAYAGWHSFAGAGISSAPGANTSGINALSAKAPAGITSGLTSIAGGSQGGGSDLSSFADALGLASFMSAPSPVAAAGATTQSSSVGSASGGRMIFNIPVTIVANDPTSFSNSSAQIASTLRRAVLFATSHMGP